MYNGLSIENADFVRVAISPAYELDQAFGVVFCKSRITFKPFGDLCTVPDDVQKITFSSPCPTGKETVIEYQDNGDTWVRDINLDELAAESKYQYFYYLCVHRINRFAFVVSLWECDSAPLKHRWEKANKPPAYTRDWDDFHCFDESQVKLIHATTVTNPDSRIYLTEAPERGLWDKFGGDRAVVRTLGEDAKLVQRLAVCVKAARRFMKRPRD